MPFLFSYGSLQDERVQLDTYKRTLEGYPDELPGFEPSLVPIEDPTLVVALGRSFHNNATFTGHPEGRVRGTVFVVTDTELAATDAYEQQYGYVRLPVTLTSGRPAWIYVHAPAAARVLAPE